MPGIADRGIDVEGWVCRARRRADRPSQGLGHGRAPGSRLLRLLRAETIADRVGTVSGPDRNHAVDERTL
jgi:hypothetical protein